MEIHSIYQNADFYYNAGLDFTKKGDMISAIILLQKAVMYSNHEEDKYLIALAELYQKIESYNESNIILQELVEKKMYYDYITALYKNLEGFFYAEGVRPHQKVSFVDLEKNKYNLMDPYKKEFISYLISSGVVKAYNLDDNLDLEDFDAILEIPEDFLEEVEEDEDVNSPTLMHFDAKGHRNHKKLSQLLTMLKTNNYAKAKEIISEIDKDVDFYYKGLNLVAILAINHEDFDQAELYVKNVLEHDPDNIHAVDLLLSIYNIKAAENDSLKVDKDLYAFISDFVHRQISKDSSISDHACDMHFTDACGEVPSELLILIPTITEAKMYDISVQISGYFLQKKPLDENYLKIHIITLYNAGMIEKARKQVKIAVKLFPNNLRLLVLHWIIQGNLVISKFTPFNCYVDQIESKSVDLINEYIKEMQNNVTRDGKSVLSLRAYEIMDLLLGLNNTELLAEVLTMNLDNDSLNYQHYLLNKLKNHYVSAKAKRLIFNYLLAGDRPIKKRIVLQYSTKIIAGIIQSVNLVKNNIRSGYFKSAYATVFSELFLESKKPNTQLLTQIMHDMYAVKTRLLSLNALAFTMHYKYILQKADLDENKRNLKNVKKRLGRHYKISKQKQDKYLTVYAPELLN